MSLDEDDILLLNNLICDVPPSEFKDMSAEAYSLALDLMNSCVHRFVMQC